MSLDIRPAADRMAVLLHTVADDDLDEPTPCSAYTVGDLVDHVGGVAMGLRLAARKETFTDRTSPPPGDGANLADGWRTEFAQRLTALAEAWDDAAAWEGMTRAGGVELPGEAAGTVAVEELVVHGWDLARAIGQPFEADDDHLQAIVAWLATFPDEARGDAYAPARPIDEGASLLDQAVALSGRDPRWRPG